MWNWLRTLAWMGFAVVATYTAAEWAVSHKATAGPGGAIVTMLNVPQKTVERPASGSVAVPVEAPTPIDVEAAYEATLRKHVDKHVGGVHRLDLEVQRIERHLKILHELKADQDRRLEMAGGVVH